MDKIKTYLSTFRLHNDKNDYYFGGVFFLVYFALLWIFLTSVPINGDLPKNFVVEEGSSLIEISKDLKKEGFIRSRTIFNAFVILKAGETKVISGEYVFTKPVTFFELIDRLTNGDYGIERRQIFIPEGATISDIGRLFDDIYPDFEKDVFYQLTEGKEGYLFPDTYFFLENVKAHEVVKVLEDNFNKKLAELKEVGDTAIPLDEVVIMASIIEKEADNTSRQEVSDILWHRINIDMALQVDATFVYSIGKGTFDLSFDDLEDTGNPFNTYVNKGLPPGPISNPGFESLRAAAFPQETEYLYFLTGHDGNMYYAETFEEHKRNKDLHL